MYARCMPIHIYVVGVPQLKEAAYKEESWCTCAPHSLYNFIKHTDLILPIHFLMTNAKFHTKFIFFELYYMGLSLKAHQDQEINMVVN